MQLLKQLFSPFQDFFYFNSKERKGIVVLLGLMLMLGLSPYYLPFFVKNKEVEKIEIPKIEAIDIEDDDLSQGRRTGKSLFPFNPNTATAEEFRQLGLYENTISSILKYREKGGKFKSAQDFSKIYTLPPAKFQELLPYILISERSEDSLKTQLFTFNPNTISKDSLKLLGFKDNYIKNYINFRNKGFQFRKKEDLLTIWNADTPFILKVMPLVKLPEQVSPQNPTFPYIEAPTKTKATIVDINHATVEEWQRLPKIGDFYAKKIINYREKLGGFVKLEQIREATNDSLYQYIKASLTLGNPNIRKIKVNHASYLELVGHPYINSDKAKLIFNTRNNKGPFKDLVALSKLPTFDLETIEKLKPYLDFEE